MGGTDFAATPLSPRMFSQTQDMCRRNNETDMRLREEGRPPRQKATIAFPRQSETSPVASFKP
jgi:hypothetical protein